MPSQNDTPRRPRPGSVTRPGRGYPGKDTRGSLPARYIGRSSARTPPSALPNALDAPCWATRGTDTPGSRASGPHVPRSCGKAGGLETPGGARTLSTMPARVCGNGGPSILLGTSCDLSEPQIEDRGSFVPTTFERGWGSFDPKRTGEESRFCWPPLLRRRSVRMDLTHLHTLKRGMAKNECACAPVYVYIYV